MRQFRKFVFIDPKLNSDQYETADDVLKIQVLYSSLSLQFILILSAASCISSLGLMSDSSVTIVGAMLIAPLMKPIMSFAYGISIGDWDVKLRSLITLAIGVVITLLISFTSERILNLHSMTTEMTSRIQPNLFDLGVAIAAGIAAAIAITRKTVADSLPGVAIAVALVPPLCVSGISLSMGEISGFFGALILFGVNLFAIILSAVIVFLLSGYGSLRFSITSIIVLAAILAVLASPLKQTLQVIEDKDTAQTIVEAWLHDNYPDKVDIHPGDLNDVSVIDTDNHMFIYLEMKASQDALSAEHVKFIHDKLQAAFNKPINLKIQLLLTKELLRYDRMGEDGKTPIYGNDFVIPRK